MKITFKDEPSWPLSHAFIKSIINPYSKPSSSHGVTDDGRGPCERMQSNWLKLVTRHPITAL